ncbi:hypothetical protein M1M14_gp118 [Synechococcus phage ACG-2014e]|jgi:hypothetical protein|uniref:Uncharacterized protein n=3 Tax=Kyanoviridae TaxID=2946160 RepID=A0A1D8KLQ1_9CAUD|nr:hypothetical protein AAJ61_gp125 [Synechococcus phage ACG-2014j]YP_009134617.1 hypothetical protein AAJ58_gp115 [Synechococcus phage ACG-2014e]YP_009320565.1 hypothetical protein BOQ05_gp132 [Synechococcus phage S-CAM4]YP_010355730.1 hypothetical protein M1M14_gp118 [Synechococcus phage ACG-2014e]AIX20581.1 hypothetical protein Syn7803C85_118 [Synechococcus phage ACG-2014e]AIX24020.1 hypothetical protein Syn7803US103_125 [Synechococcus phage ACG-2014j]AIX29796.1 hypothetical protein Syn780
MNPSLVLLLCLSPMAVIFIILKLSMWITETASFRAETDKLKRMQHGPYEFWDEEEEDEWT